MWRALALKLLGGLITLLVVITIAFAVLQLLPGDPISITEDPKLTVEDRERLKRAFGLDKPPTVQYATFVAQALRGNFGISLRYQRPVTRVLLDHLWPTVLLSTCALIVAFGLGWVFGTWAAVRPRSWADRFVTVALPGLDALPPFWLGLLAIYGFSYKLGWLPASHMTSPAGEGGLIDLLRHLVLPTLVLGIPGAAAVARHHREAMIRELKSVHRSTSEALGLAPRRVVLRAMRGALHPSLTLLGLAIPSLVSGAVVVEVVFSWPGLGQVHQQALLARDIPLVLGGLVLTGLLVVLGGVLADVLSAWVDPRWRRSGTDGGGSES